MCAKKKCAKRPIALASAPKPSSRSGSKANDGHRIFLMDAMSFIFRAYHAMARARGMDHQADSPRQPLMSSSTCSANCVTTLLLNTRAAVFDVAAPTFRDQEAEAITKVRKWDIKTQSFRRFNITATSQPQRDARGIVCNRCPTSAALSRPTASPSWNLPGLRPTTSLAPRPQSRRAAIPCLCSFQRQGHAAIGQ